MGFCASCEKRRAKLKRAGSLILEKLRRREKHAVSAKHETKKNERKKPDGE